MLENISEMDSTGWITDKQKNNISVKYKFPENCPNVTILMESIINASPIKVIALCTEVEQYSEYIPFCEKAYVFKDINLFSKVACSVMYFPVIADREAIYSAEGIDRLDENGTILL